MTKTSHTDVLPFTLKTGGRMLTCVARPRRRLSALLKFLIAMFGGQVVLWPGIATAQVATNALPTGGVVKTGAATLGHSGNAMTVNQTSSKVIINYATFNIGKEASVTFKQPDASSVALNQVVGQDPSQILGRLSSNGQVWLQNAAGVYFGKTAMVDVGGMLATSLKVNNEQFMSGGTVTLENIAGAGKVVNDGSITARGSNADGSAGGGYVALIALQVGNSGVINAPMGTVRMAAGDKVSVDIAGDGLIRLNIDKASAEAVVTNAGVISANGGTVVLSARSGGDLASLVVNNSGIIQAKSLGQRNGRIFLDGGSRGIVQNSGSLIATGEAAGTRGGAVQMAGDRVGVVGNGLVDVSGDAGGGTAFVGGNYQGKDTTSIIDGSAVKNASVAGITGSASIKADAISSGNGGKVILWANQTALFSGDISARGGAVSGNGGFIETSGKNMLTAVGSVNASAMHGQAGTWLLDPRDLTIANVANSSNLDAEFTSSGSYNAVGNNVLASATRLGNALTSGTSVVITTGTTGAQNGDITVTALTSTGAASLSLRAGGSINFTSAGTLTSNDGPLALDLSAGFGNTVVAGSVTGQTISTRSGAIRTFGGNVSMTSSGTIDLGEVDAGAGNLFIQILNPNAGAAVTQDSTKLLNVKTLNFATGTKDVTLGGANNQIATVSSSSGGTVNLLSNASTTLSGKISASGAGGFTMAPSVVFDS